MMTDDEIIAVVKAHKEGKEIEGRSFEGREWFSAIPTWNFEVCEYRVKPEPLVRWMNLTIDGNEYSHMTEDKALSAVWNKDNYARIAVKMVEAGEND